MSGQFIGMERQLKTETQRQGSNLFAFRRLKWGDPPEKFRLDRVLRNWRAPSNGRADPPGIQQTESEEQLLIVDLSERRNRERLIDLAVWAIAFVALISLAYAVLS